MKSFFSLLKSVFIDLKEFFSLFNPFKKKTQKSPKIPSIYDNKLEELNRRLNMSLYYGSENPDDALFNLTSAIKNTSKKKTKKKAKKVSKKKARK